MTPRKLSYLPMVWVTSGKIQHLAYLVEEGDEFCLVQWETTQEIVRVQAHQIARGIAPRQRRSPNRFSDEDKKSLDKKKEDADKKKPAKKRQMESAPRETVPKRPNINATPRVAAKSEPPKGAVHVNFDDDEEDALSAASLPNPAKLNLPTPLVDSPDDPENESCNNFLLDSNDDAPTPGLSFPLVQSAYLQNLAEICHIIVKDGRWRVGGAASEPLLRWEDGVDLSAVTYLSRYYLPPPKPVRKTPCTCLLCRAKNGGAHPVTESSDGDSSSSSKHDESLPEDQGKGGSLPAETGDEEIRWLYLYSRLFYRRGPWFRLDDIYDRYYSPDKKRQFSEQSTESGDSAKGSVPSKENLDLGDNNGSCTGAGPIQVDTELLERHIACFRQLTSDLSKLGRAGMFRAFQDEEECGKVAGGTPLLNAEMRDGVLQKLGGKRKKSSVTSGSHGSSTENLILNHMKQQKSISAYFSGDTSRVLPVRKHVDNIVVDLLVSNILRSSCKLDPWTYLPASIRKEYAGSTKLRLLEILNQSLKSHGTCFRLREEPQLALMRCCRLFLCATSGPGDMRSDDSNGWKCLSPLSGRPPFHRRIRPPGLETWHSVSYTGTLTRFGIASPQFTSSYRMIDPGSDKEGKFQIFCDRNRFAAWECAVELRANADYLLQLTEFVRYETRRNEKERDDSDDDGSNRKPIDGDSVDYLMLLTEQGRVKMVKRFIQSEEERCQVMKNVSEFLEKVQCAGLYEWDNVLLTIAALCVSILQIRHTNITDSELALMESRPWLRHLWWEGCVAYVLWDMIPILERFNLYESAMSALHLLLYGTPGDPSLEDKEATRLAPLLLSRRAAGKAFDRLIIDLNHFAKQQSIDLPEDERKVVSESLASSKTMFCKAVLGRTARQASIPFSAIRSLARRLKTPLSETMKGCVCIEALELQLRYKNEVSNEETLSKRGYSDWTPVTDFALANNVSSAANGAGSRCVFVGYEDDSLNVEQLAMEAYNKGKLPCVNADQDSQLAGWHGWHDEGGHIRAIFRIICGGPLLGMDWGCAVEDLSLPQQEIVHISPHQGAPFDLHVGFRLSSVPDDEIQFPRQTKSFYTRRRDRIESFLVLVSRLTRQEVCDLVYDSVKARLVFSIETGRKDSSLERDLQNLRTLSLIAGGCGGKQLASIFRCFLFDYRHWSGGLPDLLLVRGITKENGLVDLSTWIGESFSEEHQFELKNRAALEMLADDEFLACSKVGDSGGNHFRSSRRLPQQRSVMNKTYSMEDLPERLRLTYNGSAVIPETMMVEVKSSNDRLDPRQEDWLNVLDKHGNARVCKFEDSKKAKRRAEKALIKVES